ncbi:MULTISPECIES: 16S rRNA (guanine(527)-N(7))-methyltransferase RsmG [unclassified Candidatus Frackibacter]|uniref:16S rRNA (guanine(527)-N(7))-methyltransferase RsmG n=1 Tax=unclassified Candidatus Frackibacter TaxID=2648818 RepID=UPI0007983007|nr:MULTISPECIES: 16S rRNA (guanine(527)-N(7))-methyltransferase RsmG [unclassified Candidatus Frackibacter]KXS44069.1 MAG: 16S rRNA (guanine527-N7)-methyltransferase [Candidatus Frackibacter sp. T328-2]SDC43824.1 16S rRNA m(7)G-527 methyltransferase [Candidatus Frackibacter sp. WG11]SEM64183.1 16S rRNA m(7)G-527 methyltransferase [Candidatus Frackibacter sp. WG12]SFL68570.1 16S rRNA m(7)G-527 methyltransferase [Candidatus Frackibacter sp. WG13]
METKELLVTGSNKLGLELSEKQVNQFLTYIDVLKEWNKKMNLTAIDTSREIVIKHFLDSISCMKVIDLSPGAKVIDVGTGAGFPGIPLKILNPEIELSLLDSTNKRITFLKNLSRELNLSNIEFIHGRAEDYGQDSDYREQYDLVVARAVASLNVLCEYTVPFLKSSGQFISQKGAEAKNEVIEAQSAIEALGAEFYDLVSIDLPYTEAERNLVIINKVRNTPKKYPRQAGTPKQAPIS